MDKTLTSKGVARTVIDEYDEDKKNFDAFLAEGDKVKRKPKDVTTQTSRVPVDDHLGEEQSLRGSEMFDIDTAVFELPESLEDIEGSEGFLKDVEKGVTYLLRLIKNFLIWLKELVFNKTRRLNLRIDRLKYQIKASGINPDHKSPYPASAHRLMTAPKVSNNGLWVSDSLKSVKDFLEDSLAGMKIIEGYATDVTGSFTDAALFSRIKLIGGSYARALRAKEESGGVTFSRALTGSKELVVKIPDSNRVTDFKVFTRLPRRYEIKNDTFIPDLLVVEKILTQLESMIKLLAEYHVSQSSANRKFEQLVKGLLKSAKFDNNTSALNAKRMYSWLVAFHQSGVNNSINYVYDCLAAGVDFCYANLRKSK